MAAMQRPQHTPRLSHSSDKQLVGVNLHEFVETTGLHGLWVPVIAEL